MEESNKLAIPSYMCLGSGQRSRWNISIPRMPLLLQKGVKMATASKENGIGHPQGCLQSSVPGMGSAHSAVSAVGLPATELTIPMSLPSSQMGKLGILLPELTGS